MKTFETTVHIDGPACYIYLPHMKYAQELPRGAVKGTLTFGDPLDKAVNIDLDARGKVVGVELIGFDIQAGE